MNQAALFESRLTPDQLELVRGLDTAVRIQAFLDEAVYPSESFNRSPLRVIQERRAHCLDGGLLGALLLQRLGYPAVIIDLLPEPERDDDHILALFWVDGCVGAVAKSNYSGLRYREPVYRSIRELVMSYFEDCYNSLGERTLRAYARPVRLSRFERWNWAVEDAAADRIEAHLKKLKTIPLITPAQAARLNRLDELSYQAGRLGANPDGLFKVE